MPPARVRAGSEPSVYGGRATVLRLVRATSRERGWDRLEPVSRPSRSDPMAHAKDKGGKNKHVKKKAQHSIKEKRAAKKLRKGSTQRSTGLQLPE
jgi:hypothetical protein